ncbi:MAG: glycine cleavage system aminomethyltransferase GcvT [Candidatus Hadarchaeia archaeon]
MDPNFTALRNWHKSNGKMTLFSNWRLPREFSSTKDEHMAVRNDVGLFDISHMGRISIKGKKATQFLEYLLTKDPKKLETNESAYGLICNELGGTKDDVVFFKIKKKEYLIICNAGNRKKIIAWFTSLKNMSNFLTHRAEDSIKITDETFSTSLFAIQGPKSEEILKEITKKPLPERKFTFKKMEVFDHKTIVSRTGYTGEDGFEIIALEIRNEDKERAEELWNSILKKGEKYGIKPCGLGARDTLRTEAGFPLYGKELNERTTPIEAGLNFALDLENRNFIGRKYLLEQRENGPKRIRIGFKMKTKGIPRNGMYIRKNGKKVGEVTSGTYSPILEKGIGMGYISPRFKEAGKTIEIKIRNKTAEAEVVNLPFV